MLNHCMCYVRDLVGSVRGSHCLLRSLVMQILQPNDWVTSSNLYTGVDIGREPQIGDIQTLENANVVFLL